jgi:hypothetical protein
MAFGRLYEPAQSKQIAIISREHQLIHDGRMFITGKIWESVGTTTNHLLFRTNGNYAHLRGVDVNNESDTLNIEIYENPTTSADGASLPIHNLNRSSVIKSASSFFTGPTVSSNGNLIVAFSNFASSQNKTAGLGNDEGLVELMLKPTSDYLLKANAASATSLG